MDALAEEGDEGRGKAAISFGEPQAGVTTEDLRMGKPRMANPYDGPLNT